MTAFYFSSFLLGMAILGIIVRPGGLPLAIPPLAGASLLLLFGVEPLTALPSLWGIVWDAALTLIGLMVISHLLDDLGFFRWCAHRLFDISGGKGRRAWWAFMGLAWFTTAVFANDGAMLLLIPIYADMLLEACLDRKQIFAFLFPAGFLIDVASTPLVTSNLTNIMAADYFHLDFWAYARLMALPSLVLGFSSLGILWLVFRRSIPRQIPLCETEESISKIALTAGVITLLSLGIGFAFAHRLHCPVSGIVWLTALILLLLNRMTLRSTLRETVRKTPWSIAIFALALFVLVDGIARHGGSDALTQLWNSTPTVLRPFSIGGSIGLLGAGINNLPALLLGLLGMDRSSLALSIIGANVAPKLTPYGSLATLLWFAILSEKGIKISWKEYFRFSLPLTPPIFFAGIVSVVLFCS